MTAKLREGYTVPVRRDRFLRNRSERRNGGRASQTPLHDVSGVPPAIRGNHPLRWCVTEAFLSDLCQHPARLRGHRRLRTLNKSNVFENSVTLSDLSKIESNDASAPALTASVDDRSTHPPNWLLLSYPEVLTDLLASSDRASLPEASKSRWTFALANSSTVIPNSS